MTSHVVDSETMGMQRHVTVVGVWEKKAFVSLL